MNAFEKPNRVVIGSLLLGTVLAIIAIAISHDRHTQVRWAEDHLVPASPWLSRSFFDPTKPEGVWFKDAYAPDVTMRIVRERGMYNGSDVTFLESHEGSWKLVHIYFGIYPPPRGAVSRCQSAVSPPLAEGLIKIWRSMLQETRQPTSRPSVIALDPDEVEFSLRTPGGQRAGDLPSAFGPNTKTEALYHIAQSLEVLCDGHDDKRLADAEREVSVLIYKFPPGSPP